MPQQSAKHQFHSTKARLNNGMTRISKVLEETEDPAEREALRRQILEDLGIDVESRVAEDDAPIEREEDEEVLSLLRQTANDRDYSFLLEMLENQEKATTKLLAEATTDSERGVRMRRLAMIQKAKRLVTAAKQIKPELRTFGCTQSRMVRIPGNDTGLPTIQFRYHTYSTSDPLAIAMLLDYITNKHPTDPPIRERNPGDVALVDSSTGEFMSWVNGMEADEIIKESGGRLRRSYR